MTLTRFFNKFGISSGSAACILFLVIGLTGCQKDPLPTDWDAVELVSPQYITSQVGATVRLEVKLPKGMEAICVWSDNQETFSTDDVASLNLDKIGLREISLKVMDNEGGLRRSWKITLFAAKRHPYKVIAYYPSWRPSYVMRDWDKVSHICCSFGETRADGSVDASAVQRNMKSVIRAAHNNGVYAMLSLGGGDGGSAFSQALLNESSRKKIADQSLDLMTSLKLDGIDVDFEHWDYAASAENTRRCEALEALLKDLRSRMPSGTLLSIASASGYMRHNGYRSSMTQYLDFISLMIYNDSGNWASSAVGPHSGWNFYVESVQRARSMGIPDAKIIPGIPFYGMRFPSATNPVGATSITYSAIVDQYPGAEDKNAVTEAFIYYDGKPIVAQKSQYVVAQKLGGMMFWELTQDAGEASKSLLEVIHKELTGN